MTTVQSEPESPAPARSEPRIRVLYRDRTGQLHDDWPHERISEAVADTEGVVWVDIEDHEAHLNEGVEALLRDVFQFHPLAIEDALEESHVPRVDDWGDYLYIVFQSVDCDSQTADLRLHELDIFVGRNFLVSYHNEPLGLIDQLQTNIKRGPVNHLQHGADYLLYYLLDACVDGYLPAIEHLDEAIDQAQDEVFKFPTPRTLHSIFRVKRAALRLHRVLSPQREVLNRLARDDYAPIRPESRVYFRDVYDHIVRTHDISETLRDLISGALDTYLSAIANRTNDIMKTLTLVSVMFLPMSFLVGFFGMNFFSDNIALPYRMPRRSLFVVSCLIMAMTPWMMWVWAKRRRWF